MEKELMIAFDAVEKAAAAAASDDGAAAEDRCLDALKLLRRMPVTTKDLVATQNVILGSQFLQLLASLAFLINPMLITKNSSSHNECRINLGLFYAENMVCMKLLIVGKEIEVGKRIRSLTKHPKPRIQEVAADLFKLWKNVVIKETSYEGKKSGNSEVKNILKTESKSVRSEIAKVDMTSKPSSSINGMRLNSESFMVEMSPSDKFLASEKFSRSENVKLEKTMKGESGRTFETNSVETIKLERISKDERQTSVVKKPVILNGPPKMTSIIKCNDPLRDKFRELLAEAFSKVPVEASNDERDEVNSIVDEINTCDPIRVAITVESAMFEKLGRSNGTHKIKYRSIMFNLKDSKNTDLRRRVLLGHIIPEKLINMTAEEMASDERKLVNKQIQEKALFECQRAAAPKATTDQFKCGRCGQRKCTYYQLQTRSADEPMTTFVTCVNCNNHWKFC